jgi:molybdopterin-guanine dinucleotide biosynthesis protein A
VIARSSISLGILAGGQGLRLGGVDKAFVEYRGRTLLSRTLEALGGGFREILISHPRDDARFFEWGIRPIHDLRPGFLGPLAGLEALLAAASSEWLLSLPVDLRDIPTGLCETLADHVADHGSTIHDADGDQPLVTLWAVAAARKTIAAALDRNEGAVHRLTRDLGLSVHDLSPQRLGNLNTPKDFSGIE